MIVRLQIDDKLWEVYERRAAALAKAGRRAHASPEDIMGALLDRCKSIDPISRPFVLKAETREMLEVTLNCPIRDDLELLQAVKDLAELQIGGIRIDLTPGQWKVLRSFAVQHDQPLVDLVKTVAERTVQHVFDGGLAFAGLSRVL